MMQNLHIIMRNYQANTNWGAFYQITTSSQKYQDDETQGKTEEWLQVKETKEPWQLNAMWHPGLDSRTEEWVEKLVKSE